MSTTHTEINAEQASTDPRTDRIAAIVALVFLAPAIYAAFALGLGIWAGAGFCVIVPSVIGSTVARVATAGRES